MSPGARDEKEIWEELVASFDASASDGRPWPEQEDLPDDGPGQVARKAAEAPEPSSDATPAPAQNPEDHYVPPPAPPLPRFDPVTKVAWLALFGGPGYLLLSAMLGWEVPGWTAFIAVAAFVGGFVTLVLRMGDEHSPDSGWDDGAVL